MKKKLIEKLPVKKTRKKGVILTAQGIEDPKGNILILNIFKDKNLKYRYCINTETGEFANIDKNGLWGTSRLKYLMGADRDYYYGRGVVKNKFDSKDDEALALGMIDLIGDAFNKIERAESAYLLEKSERAEDSKKRRIATENAMIPDLPADFDEWIYNLIGENKDYAMREDGEYHCTACGYKLIGKYKNNSKIMCQGCGKEIIVKSRSKKIIRETQVMLIQAMSDDMTSIRTIDARVEWLAELDKRLVGISVARVIVAYKKKKPAYRIYYNQESKSEDFGDGWSNTRSWWRREGYWTSNPASRRADNPCYLYPGETEALEGTIYEPYARIFRKMAETREYLNYNRLLMDCYNHSTVSQMIEYLYKGRFYHLLKDTVNSMFFNKYNSRLEGGYCGELNPWGNTIEEVFKIEDRQVINRIRDIDGGNNAYIWLRQAYELGEKMPQNVLVWLNANNIRPEHVSFIQNRMSIVQIVNYVERQKRESYQKQTCIDILNQWDDYLDLCEKLRKKTDDEMIYKPRELRRRHDEAVAELVERQAELEAEEYSERYGAAERVLHEVREKFEYRNDEFLIQVPELIVDIVKEGRYLHHCAGASDRYFERIKNNETYICFLRKAAEPEIPFYTIEVEPGGTIRQHRGMYDEEPEFDMVKPFLQEWQRVIKQRMTEADRKNALISGSQRMATLRT